MISLYRHISEFSKKTHLIILFFLLFLISVQAANSQSGKKVKTDGKVSGTVIDSDSLLPIPGAAISIHDANDSTLIKGTYTDSKGKFSIEKIRFGHYYLKITSVGYVSKFINSIVLSENDSRIKTGKIKLNSKSISTGEIEVTGQKEFIQVEPDKLVVHIDQSLVSSGGTAIDALRNIPVISVDVDDNVKLRGSENIKFLIDGKPSNIANADFLEVIPASSIEKIEIITNPSSKFDAEGNAGIINIILKKNEANRNMSQLSANAGTQDKYSASAMIGMSGNKLSSFFSYHAKSHNMFGTSDQLQDRFMPDDSGSTNRHQSDLQKKRNQGLRFGLDYKFDESNILSLNAHYIYHDKDIDKYRNYYDYDNNNIFIDYHEKSILNDNVHQNLDANLNYTMKFNQKGHELNFGAFISPAERKNYYDYDHKYFSVNSGDIILDNKPDLLEKSKTNSNGYNWTFQTDYTLPLKNHQKLEAGYKAFQRISEMDFEYDTFFAPDWIIDTIRTNNFHYKETTHALYGIFSDKYYNLYYNFGLRAEYTLINSQQITTKSNYHSDYLYLFPSIQAKYEFSPMSNLRFSASRRINRPAMKNLNPFINYSDPQELSSGNPYLKPELSQQYELGYYHLFSNTTFLFNVFYKLSNEPHTNVTMLIDTGSRAILTKPMNYNGLQNYGTELIVTHQLFSWFKFDANVCYYEYILNGEFGSIPYLAKQNDSWNAKFTGYFKIGKLLNLQLAANYFSAITDIQSKAGAYYSVDLGLKVNLIKNVLSFNLKGNDIFHTLKSSNNIYSPNFIIYNNRQKDTRYIIAGITFNFNSIPENLKNRMKEDTPEQEELNEKNEDDEE